jgi:putative transposase
MQLFRKDADYEAFEQVLIEVQQRHPIRILSYCLLPDRWHFVVWPAKDGQLAGFCRWVAHSHALRWRAERKTPTDGLYHGRFKNFIIQRDSHTVSACRYVEGLALAEGLVKRAEKWRWSSLGARLKGEAELKGILSPWPVPRPGNWTDRLNRPMDEKELEHIETCLKRNRPYGDEKWLAQTVAKLHLESTIRPQGRPRVIKKK